jgi:hypothetical protein
MNIAEIRNVTEVYIDFEELKYHIEVKRNQNLVE